MSLWLSVDAATGRANLTTGVPVAADPYVNGLRYQNVAPGALYVQAGPAPAGVPKLGGIARDDQGVMYALIDVIPNPKFYNDGGMLTDSTGAVALSTSNPISGSNGGVPVDSNGAIAVAPGGFGPTAIFDAPLTSSLVPKTAGDPSFTFTRATTAYVQDCDGILRNAISGEARFQGARRVRNFAFGNSTNLTNAQWVLSSATVSFGVVGPTGQADANTVTATGPTALVFQNVFAPIGYPTGVRGVTSAWLRRRTGTGAVFIRDANNASINITSQLDGTWKRFGTASVIVTSPILCPVEISISGDAVDVAYAQYEVVDGQSNTAPGDYVSVGVLAAPYHGAGVDGVKYFGTTNGNSVAANVVTEAAGVAITAATLLGYVAENQATNLCLQSQTLNTAWAQDNCVITADTQTAPDGSLTADTLTDTASNTQHRAYNSIAVVNAATYTGSVYAKAGTLTWLQMVIAGATNQYANFNLQTGALGLKSAGVTSVITALPNGWYRCSMTVTTDSAASTIQFAAANANSAFPVIYAGSGQTMYLWGAQVEAASDASSYIPTTSAAVTRNSDALNYPVVSNINWVTGTAYSECYTPVAGVGVEQDILAQNPNYPQYYDGVTKRLGISVGPTVTTANARTLGAVNKNASAWSGTTASVCLNGGAVAAGGFTTYAAGGNITVGNSVGPYSLSGSLRNLRFYATRLTDVQLQAMTS